MTLTGPGGSGKTRLAVELAAALAERGCLVVWFVPLQDLRDPGLIPDRILEALRLPRSPHVEPMAQIAAALSQQPSLLLLDNFEHLLAEGAREHHGAMREIGSGLQVIRTLLEQVPALAILVTSRRCLDLAGEQEFPVPPLPVPVVSGQWPVEVETTALHWPLATGH